MSNVSLDYASITSLISVQLFRIFGNNYADSGYTLYVEQEREFTKEVELHPKSIYIVVSFGGAETNFGQSTMPVFLECVSEENSFAIARELLTAFVVNNTLKRVGGFYQYWESPVMNAKFNEVGKGFRAFLYVSGNVSTGDGETINDVARLWWDNDGTYEQVEFLTFTDGYQGVLQPQAYPDGNGFAKSQASYGTYTFTIATYPLNNDFFEKINQVKYAGNHENDSFSFKIVLVANDTGSADDTGFEIEDMRLLSANSEKNVGANATVACVFTR